MTLTTNEIAKRLKKSRRTVQRWIRATDTKPAGVEWRPFKTGRGIQSCPVPLYPAEVVKVMQQTMVQIKARHYQERRKRT